MGLKLVPLNDFSQIEEGHLLGDVNELLAIEPHFLLAHVKRWGYTRTKKDKVKITVEITIQPGEVPEDYLISGRVKTQRPGRPTKVTRAIHNQEQTGEDVLFIRASGTDESSPREGKLFTEDGRAIDPETGFAEPKALPKKKGD